ncbi:DUF1330 domain-containing protein [Azospirillum sp.]|uniref:DUF1330 domain-containing protein n=1 Tax=Azospirillum sp. TaxID=34012 RepID=UPI003D738863
MPERDVEGRKALRSPHLKDAEEDLSGLLDFVPAEAAGGPKMSAYLIVEADVHDPVAYDEYRKLSSEAVRKHGATFLVRGGAMHVLEGDWQPKRIVVLAFPSAEAAHAFYHSPEYEKARDARKHAAKLNIILVEGM